MKLIKQARLGFREGNSDKVYEADLLEVGPGQYVVNFRYGRRGAVLKDGTKTPLPVSLADAEALYVALVAEKTKKGYAPLADGESPSPPPPPPPAAKVADTGAREAAILARLAPPEAEAPVGPLKRLVNAVTGRKATRKPERASWPISRVAWRAGELALPSAVPALVDLLGKGEALQDYAICAALGRCGDRSAMSPLAKVYRDDARPSMVRRMACEALLRLSPPELAAQFRAEQVQRLPAALRDLAAGDDPVAFDGALIAYLAEGPGSDSVRHGAIPTLYLIDSPTVRPALLAWAVRAPFQPPAFQRMRHLFKAAEYRRDGEVFALIAKRFEKERATFDNSRAAYNWYGTPMPDGQTLNEANLAAAMRAPNAKYAYGSLTRNYMRRRIWRTLRRLAQSEGAAAYTAMAQAVLLTYHDGDAHPPKVGQLTDGQRRKKQKPNRWDAFAPYDALNHVLYRHSPRYHKKRGTKAWRCNPTYEPGQPAPDVREEAFPAFWDAHPERLVALLVASRCAPVHDFAARALTANSAAWPAISLADVINFLAAPYEATGALGFALAKGRYNPADPDLALLLAVLHGLYAPGREQGRLWASAQAMRLAGDGHFLADLITSPQADTRAFALTWLPTLHASDPAVLIAHVVARLLALPVGEAAAAIARDAAATLRAVFPNPLRALGPSVLFDMVVHPLAPVAELGAAILLDFAIPAENLPQALLRALIDSPLESLRRAGIALFCRLPNETVLLRLETIVAFCTHALPDVRDAIRPALAQLARAMPAFARQIAPALLAELLRRERHEGVHAHLARILEEDLADFLRALAPDTVVNLLGSAAPIPHDVGGRLFTNRREWEALLDPTTLVTLASHDLVEVRRTAWAMLAGQTDRWRRDPDDWRRVIRWLDATWDDARAAAFTYFRGLPEAVWTADALVGLCDGVREDVQQFGQALITRSFDREDGPFYLMRLAEHPSERMQRFASTWLAQHGANDPARLAALAPFIAAVLGVVNRGRVAKDRVLAFLETEALQNEDAARVVAEQLGRLSATIAIGDRARAIAILLAIRLKYPDLASPLALQPIPLRGVPV